MMTNANATTTSLLQNFNRIVKDPIDKNDEENIDDEERVVKIKSYTSPYIRQLLFENEETHVTNGRTFLHQ
jgi:hypothetical protein